MKKALLLILSLAGCAHRQPQRIPDPMFRSAWAADIVRHSPDAFIWRTDGGAWYCRLDEGNAVKADTFEDCISSAAASRFMKRVNGD